MIAFIDAHRADAHRGRADLPVCRLPRPPSTIIWPSGRSGAAVGSSKRVSTTAARDRARLRGQLSVYGVRKVWHQMRREGFDVARCTVARLMKDMGIEGVIRGKKHRTTIPDKAQPCPLDKVNRQFRAPAPNMLWVSDFTYDRAR
jgi:putative transposase